MSQKQAKVRKKGGDDNIQVVGNAWEGFKKCGWSVEVINVMFGCPLKHQIDGVVKIMTTISQTDQGLPHDY